MAGNGERTRCLKSEEHIEFLWQVKAMLLPLVDDSLKCWIDDSLRVNYIRGASTLSHTDSYKGNTTNFMFIAKEEGVEPGWLCYETWPVFKTSVVKLFGRLFVPHSYSEACNECKCIGLAPNGKGPMYYVFPASVTDLMEPHGKLDYGVVGWTVNGYIQLVPEYEGVCLCTAPLNFYGLKWDQLMENASEKKNRVYKKPHIRTVRLDKVNQWMEFRAYSFRYWWVGNPMTLRCHAFFRIFRQNPTSSNVNRKGQCKINYVDATDL